MTFLLKVQGTSKSSAIFSIINTLQTHAASVNNIYILCKHISFDVFVSRMEVPIW